MNRFVNRYFFYYPIVLLRGQMVPVYLRRMRRTQWYSADQLQQIQLQKLIRILGYAKSENPYYRRALKDIEPDSFQSLTDLQRIPILTKEAMKEHFDDLRPKHLRGAIKKSTSGSTGNPVTVYKSLSASAATYAAYWRGFEWADVHVGDPQGRFWGVPHHQNAIRLTKFTDIVMNRHRCSAFALKEEDLAGCYESLNRFKPRYFYGYVSMLAEFAKFLIRNGLTLKYNLVCVITTSELLTESHRALFENAFRCRVYNEYGSSELGTIAHECEQGSLHISAERMIVETVRAGRLAAPGESGNIVVTELNNRAMPLIRYSLGDSVTLTDQKCQCGRGLPIIREIAGRVYDTIYNRQGQPFTGHFFTYISADLESRGFQLSGYQVVQLDLDNLLVRLVTDEPDRQQLEKYLQERIGSGYGKDVRLHFEYVPEIEREKSGKIRQTKSMVKPE